MNDFSEVLRGALRIAECDDTQYVFDAHSPITMAFTDVGDITFVPEENEVWIWHELANTPLWRLSSRATDLLELLAAPVAFLSAGCTNLRLEEDSLWLGGMLSHAARDDAAELAAGLNDFHAMITTVRGFL